MMNIVLSQETERDLQTLHNLTGHSEPELLHEAVLRYLEETVVERSLLADLLERSRLYHTSKDYLDLLAFVSRLRNFAAFNAMLLQIQRQGLTYAASKYDWRTRLLTKAAGQVETALGIEAHTLFERLV